MFRCELTSVASRAASEIVANSQEGTPTPASNPQPITGTMMVIQSRRTSTGAATAIDVCVEATVIEGVANTII